MKSKKWKKITIKSRNLKSLRKSLRTVLKLAVDDRNKDLIKNEKQLRLLRKPIDEDLSVWREKRKGVYSSQELSDFRREILKKYDYLEKEREEINNHHEEDLLRSHYNKSILVCSFRNECISLKESDLKDFEISSLDLDMVWNPLSKDWHCKNCHNFHFGTRRARVWYTKQFTSLIGEEKIE